MRVLAQALLQIKILLFTKLNMQEKSEGAMKLRFITYLTALVLFGFSMQAFAVPTAPTLIYSINGLTVTAAWTDVPGATEYKLSYAPFPYTGPESIGSIDVGGKTSFSATLREGAAFYIAVQAGNEQGFSEYSNIKNFTISVIAPKKIGDSYGGGIVFYVNGSGQHGLIAALEDASASVFAWNNGANKVTGATSDGEVGAGAMNTAIIVAAQSIDNPFGNFAAKVANDYSVQDDGLTPCARLPDEICYDDWYLPSRFELNLLYQQKDIVGGFADLSYWSSTEDDSLYAWSQYFLIGQQFSSSKSLTFKVRAVRAF